MSVFEELQYGLITWRRMGHGLWPIRDWPVPVIENYVITLKEWCTPDTIMPLPVVTGRDLIHLIRHILNLFPPSDESFSDDPQHLLETILFALIGLVYPEEPGDLTIDELLRDS